MKKYRVLYNGHPYTNFQEHNLSSLKQTGLTTVMVRALNTIQKCSGSKASHCN